MRATTRASTGNNVQNIVTVDVRGRNTHATGESLGVGKEGAHLLQIDPIKHFHMGTTSNTGTRDNIRNAIVVDIFHRNENTTRKGLIISKEGCAWHTRLRIQNSHRRAATWAGCRNYL